MRVTSSYGHKMSVFQASLYSDSNGTEPSFCRSALVSAAQEPRVFEWEASSKRGETSCLLFSAHLEVELAPGSTIYLKGYSTVTFS